MRQLPTRAVTAVLAAGLASLGLPVLGASTAAADVSSCPTVSVNIPNTIVLGQSDRLTHPVVSTGCPLELLSFGIYDPSNSSVDGVFWDQTPTVNGDAADWTIYNSSYTAGVTYHSDQVACVDSDFDDVSFRPVSFKVLDASATRITGAAVTVHRQYKNVRVVKVIKHKKHIVVVRKLVRTWKTVAVTGATSQWVQSADYGQGAMAGASEAVQLQTLTGARWVTAAKGRSTAAGRVAWTVMLKKRTTYRLVVPGTASVVAATSAPITR